jgi:CRP/FNR family transcriptional regulator, cyclic AMP receptor protein
VPPPESRFARSFKAGEVIFREGEPGRTMFVVRTGQVRISKQVRGGERTLATLGPGEFFGEMAVLSGRPRTATATASSALSLLELDSRRFETMINTQAEITARILKKLARRLDDADSLIAILSKRDPKTRVILGLIREAEEHGLPGEGHDSRVVRRDFGELATELGVRQAELDEVIARMVRVGLVRPVQGGVELASIAKLMEFLGFLEQRGIIQE